MEAVRRLQRSAVEISRSGCVLHSQDISGKTRVVNPLNKLSCSMSSSAGHPGSLVNRMLYENLLETLPEGAFAGMLTGLKTL